MGTSATPGAPPDLATGAAPAAPAGPVVTATDPGGILAQLAQAPPSVVFAAVDQAEQASPAALGAQRDEAERQLPEMSAPTGLAPEPGLTPAGPAPAAQQRPVPDVRPDAAPAEQPDLPVPEVATVPAPLPTALPGPPAATEDEAEQARLEERAREAMDLAGASPEEIDRAFPTSFGARPTIGLTGDADPQQLDAQRGPADAATAAAKADAAAGIDADHGLGRIHPAPTDARLSARRPLAGSSAPVGAGSRGPGPALSGDVSAGLDRELAPGLAARLGAHRDEYAAGQKKFEAESAQAHADSRDEIARLRGEAAATQREEQRFAAAQVGEHQEQWREELDVTEQEYLERAGAAVAEHRGKIEEKHADGERQAAEKIDRAEVDAEAARRDAELKAEAEKSRKRKESKGFVGWLRDKAAAFIDALKDALNAIFDQLRAVIKGIFDLAKRAAMLVIDTVRSAIVGMIKAFGVVLKGFVTIALAAFPKTAARIRAAIDTTVDVAVEHVNAVADKLKSAVAAALDFLASTIDKLLALVQSLYNGLLTVISMLVRGELKELMERFGDIVAAARGAPSRFEAAAYEELLGGDFDEPLSAAELLQAGVTTPATVDAGPAGVGGHTQPMPAAAQAGDIPQKPFTERNVEVDEVVTNAEISPEVMAEAEAVADSGGSAEIARQDTPDRSLDAIMAEALGRAGIGEPRRAPEEAASADQTTTPAKNPPDGLDPRGRAAIRWKLMKDGLATWFSDHKVEIIAGTVAALLALAALIFFSGGSILAAIPPIMAALGPLFIGATVATIAGHVEDFVRHGWERRVDQGSKSLAKAAAAGAVELLSWLTFKAGGAAVKGAKAAVKLGAKAGRAVATGATKAAKAGFAVARRGLTAAGRFVARGIGYVIARGKIILQGAKGFATRQFKKLRDLGKALLDRIRFKALVIVEERGDLWLAALINPPKLLLRLTGVRELQRVTRSAARAARKQGKVVIRVSEELLARMTKPIRGAATNVASKLKLSKLGEALIGTRVKLGRMPPNFEFAGRKFELPNKLANKYSLASIKFTKEGFPIFPKKCIKGTVKFKLKFKGDHKKDFAAAFKQFAAENKMTVREAKEFARGYTWHHVEDLHTMQLVPTDLHDAVRHAGGVALTP